MPQNGKTALILAAGSGHREVSQALMTAGADKEAKDIVSGRWEVSQALMDAGANKETRDKVGVCVSRQGW